MYSEITKELFRKLVNVDQPVSETEQLEHGFKIYYDVEGVTLLEITNYIGGVTQYYIKDINA